MFHTVHKSYCGWTVTIRCTQQLPSAGQSGIPRFESVAMAELEDGQDPGEWIDSRMQLLDTGARSFASGTHCVDTLYTEVKELIDALRR